METSYWHRMVSRRRVMAASALGIGSAALLAACGGGSGTGSSSSSGASASTAASKSTPSGQALSKQVPYTPQSGTPQPGGRFVLQTTSVQNFNPVAEWSEGT